MCGRYVLAGEPSHYAHHLGVSDIVTEGLDPSFNVAPTDQVYAATEWDGSRLLGQMRWGLVPHWSEDPRSIHINARLETVATKPVFRDSFRRKRCIIPADGFYEWTPAERGRVPHWIYRADGYPMAFAGIWSSWKEPESGAWVRSCAILTTEARGVVAPVHPRMPAILDPASWDLWLDRSLTDPEEASQIVQVIDDDLLLAHPVSPRVGSVRNNGPELIEPVDQQRLL